MITPFEIENKDFSKTVRGYNCDEVDEFLDLIILDLQKIMVENQKLKAEIEELNQDMGQYKKSETSVMNTLESAKKLMSDISESAEKRAEIILKNAQLDAEIIQRDAKESISRLLEDGNRLKGKVIRFKDRYKQILENELIQLDGSSEDLIADLETDFLPASMAQPVARKTPVDRPTVNQPIEKTPIEEKQPMNETMIINDKSFEEMLMEDFGKGEKEKAKEKAKIKEDLSKTRII